MATCACPASCTASSACTDAVEECRGSLREIQGLYVMESNGVYRVSDLLGHEGLKWRSDSLIIMCNPRYRRTLLRSFFREYATMNFTEDQGGLDSDEGFEKTIGRHITAEVGAGYACAVGDEGPSGITLMKSQEKFAYHVVQKIRGGLFKDLALDTDLVVSVRLGDWRPQRTADVSALVEKALSKTEGVIKRIVFSGVLHYGGYGEYVASKESVMSSVSFVQELRQHWKEKGHEAVIRSEPVADKDLAYMASAKHLVIGGQGFARLVGVVRKRLQHGAIPAKSGSARHYQGFQTWVDAVLDGVPEIQVSSDRRM